jgi:hypothetical protein
MVAATAVWVARHQKGGVIRLRAGVDPGTSSSSTAFRQSAPKFEWAIDLGRLVLSVRTADASWKMTPVHCVVYDERSDRDLGEAWVMLSEEAEDASVYGEAALTTYTRHWPTQHLRAEVKGYESFDLLPPEGVALMRDAFSNAHLTGAREAWQAWIDRELADGRLAPEQVAAITGKLP